VDLQRQLGDEHHCLRHRVAGLLTAAGTFSSIFRESSSDASRS